MTDDELTAAGISPGMVRLSCGLEGTEDLIADLEQALTQRGDRGCPPATATECFCLHEVPVLLVESLS